MDLLFDATAILESIADSFFVLDSGGRFAFVTSKACELLGRPSSEILGKTVAEAFPEEPGSEFLRSIEQAFRHRAPARFEHFRPQLNRWFEQQVYVNHDGGIAVYGRDVTARRRLEEALRASEDRFRRLVDANVIGVCVADGQQITEANDQFLVMIGYTRDELVRHQIAWSVITAAEQHGFDETRECELVRKNGTRIPVTVASTRIGRHAGDGQTENWEVLYLVHDLSHRKLAETRLRHLVEATKILGSSLDVQKTLHELAHFLASDIGHHCSIYISEGGTLHPAAHATRNSAAEPPDVSQMPEMDRVLSKGTSEIIGDTGILVPLPARRRIIGALFCVVSKNTVDYEDLHFLEDVGRRAGIAVENSLLYKQTEVASRLKDEFVSALSHELRTPLTPILGAVYMLRAEPGDRRIFNKALDLIERNAKAQSKIVEDLLDVSRIISGNFRIRQESVELESAICAALETVKPAAEAKRIAIQVKLAPLNGTIFGDSERLQQIFWNILSNAVKFTPNGGRIVVELLQNGEQAETHITDTGIGIAEEFLPYVFDRFSREDMSRTRVHGGLGIGLAIVLHLVESHGGTVHAQSSGNGKGSTFVVKLPLRVAANQDLRSRSASITG
jgi:PAS domain S-box-containing protein